MIRDGPAFFFFSERTCEAGLRSAGFSSGEISQFLNSGSSRSEARVERVRGGPSMEPFFQRKKKSFASGWPNFLLAHFRKFAGTNTLLILLLNATNRPLKVVSLFLPIKSSMGIPVAASVERAGYSTREGARPKFQRSR